MAGGLPGIQASSPGFVDKAKGLLAQSGQSFSQQDRVIKQAEEEKSAGGALQGAAAGAAAGTMVLPGWGTAIGAVVGAAAYMLT
jgi:outer membrane lipoprotein SlyB